MKYPNRQPSSCGTMSDFPHSKPRVGLGGGQMSHQYDLGSRTLPFGRIHEKMSRIISSTGSIVSSGSIGSPPGVEQHDGRDAHGHAEHERQALAELHLHPLGFFGGFGHCGTHGSTVTRTSSRSRSRAPTTRPAPTPSATRFQQDGRGCSILT